MATCLGYSCLPLGPASLCLLTHGSSPENTDYKCLAMCFGVTSSLPVAVCGRYSLVTGSANDS